MAQHDDENPMPKWLDEENDQTHAEEISPLFGTGKIPDEESSASNHNDGIVFGESPSNKGYGAINNDDSEDEEDDNSQKKNANKPMGLFGSLSQKIKNRRRTSLSSSTTVSGVSGTSGASSSNGNKNTNKDNTKKQHKQQGPNKTSKIVITESGKPEYPHRNCMLSTFCFLEAFGVVTSLCLMATQVIPMLVIKNTWSELGAMNIVLKIYISLFCLLFVLLEWDAPIPFVKDAVFLQRYFSRGFLYSFLGLSCLAEAYSERVSDVVEHADERFHVPWLALFMQISSWMMVSLGVVYMLLGICCMKVIRDRMKSEYQERWETYKDAMKIYKENTGRW